MYVFSFVFAPASLTSPAATAPAAAAAASNIFLRRRLHRNLITFLAQPNSSPFKSAIFSLFQWFLKCKKNLLKINFIFLTPGFDSSGIGKALNEKVKTNFQLIENVNNDFLNEFAILYQNSHPSISKKDFLLHYPNCQLLHRFDTHQGGGRLPYLSATRFFLFHSFATKKRRGWRGEKERKMSK